MATPNPFNMPSYHLGDTSSYTKVDVDASFKVANVPSKPVCIVCKQPARYRLISKANHIPQDTLDRQRAYICQYHMEQQAFNPSLFALQDLDGLDRRGLPIL